MILQKPGQQLNPSQMVPTLVIWGAIIAIVIVSLIKQKLTSKISLALLLTTFITTGLIIGGTPNPLAPLQIIFTTIGAGNPASSILSMITVVVALLVLTLFVGRLFCGKACFLGAMQELASRVTFKTKPKKRWKYIVDVPSNIVTKLVRFAFFMLFAISAIISGLAITQFLNPFSGFKIFKAAITPAVMIPLIWIIGILLASFFIYRPWCRFLCPFGAIASFTSKWSLYKLRRTDACTECGLCENSCPTGEATATSMKKECYFCGRCIEVCPSNAIRLDSKS